MEVQPNVSEFTVCHVFPPSCDLPIFSIPFPANHISSGFSGLKSTSVAWLPSPSSQKVKISSVFMSIRTTMPLLAVEDVPARNITLVSLGWNFSTAGDRTESDTLFHVSPKSHVLYMPWLVASSTDSGLSGFCARLCISSPLVCAFSKVVASWKVSPRLTESKSRLSVCSSCFKQIAIMELPEHTKSRTGMPVKPYVVKPSGLVMLLEWMPVAMAANKVSLMIWRVGCILF